MQPEAPFRIDGIVPIIPTPFAPDEGIAWDQLPRLIDFAIAAGACAICLPAYASEFYKLSEEERDNLVSEAARHAAGRIPVIGQVNYPGAVSAARAAVRCRQNGAAAISAAAPRLFPLRESDLRRYFAKILNAIDIPLIIQDFNPGGPTLTPAFVAALHNEFPHFRYVKLEEAMMAAKVEAIRRLTHEEVGVIEGWGGMYTLELARTGICGVMPGLALTDLLDRAFRLARDGKREAAYEVFAGILPQIVFSLQNLELFHHAEKRLLEARGALQRTGVRDAGLELDAIDAEHIDFLNRAILELLNRLGMAANPAAAAAVTGRAPLGAG
ncbi:MAG: dihydrodipicolinate synthase family protein [Bryobacteraceae bacterium]|nr:dihydrodipicolinate synthase family protein [Bryobacteraceae bacterium]